MKIGDTVKVISSTEFNGEQLCFYPLETICRVVDIDTEGALGILPLNVSENTFPYYYLENELEKGHIK